MLGGGGKGGKGHLECKFKVRSLWPEWAAGSSLQRSRGTGKGPLSRIKVKGWYVERKTIEIATWMPQTTWMSNETDEDDYFGWMDVVATPSF